MRREVIEELVEKMSIKGDLFVDEHLEAELGAIMRSNSESVEIFKAKRPLRPFCLSRYEGQGLISLTYDDGQLNNYVSAAPLHLRYGIPANFAVVAKHLLQSSDSSGFMTPRMCRILVELGFEISSHGLLHSKFLHDMTLKELHQEAYLSRSVIERVIGVPGSVQTYCVPFSRIGSLHADYLHNYYPIVRQAGKALNDIPIRPRRCISSFPLTKDVSLETIKELINDAIENQRALVLLLHGISVNGRRPDEHEISEQLLDQILCYISKRGPRLILPVRLSEYQKITRTAVRGAQRRRARHAFFRNIRENWLSFMIRQP